MRSGGSTHSYLVTGGLPDLTGVPFIPIQEAYMAPHSTREVLVRKSGQDFSLIVRSEHSKPSFLHHSPISPQSFDDFWRLSTNHRVELLRYFFPLGRDVIVMDVFGGRHAPLVLARITFPTLVRRRSFRKPAFLGEEIPPEETGQMRQIALYGKPLVRQAVTQAGVLPFLFKRGILHVVLVTSSSGSRWIIPKGKLESGMTHKQVALMEAAEEAGAIGILEPGMSALCHLDDKRELYLYPMRVATLLSLWPERLVRRRVVLPIHQALLRILDVDLARAVRSLSRQIPPEPDS